MKTFFALAAKCACIGTISGGGAAFAGDQHWWAFPFIAIGVVGLDFWAEYKARHDIPF